MKTNIAFNFNEAEAKEYLRQDIKAILDKENSRTILFRVLPQTMMFGLVGALFSMGLSFVVRGILLLFSSAPQISLQSFLLIVGIGFVAGCGVYFIACDETPYRDAKESLRQYTLKPDADLADLYRWYCGIYYWSASSCFRIWRSYEGYCALSKATRESILEIFDHSDHGHFTVTYTKEDGQIDNFDIKIDETRNNSDFPNDTIMWENGKVIFLKKDKDISNFQNAE